MAPAARSLGTGAVATHGDVAYAQRGSAPPLTQPCFRRRARLRRGGPNNRIRHGRAAAAGLRLGDIGVVRDGRCGTIATPRFRSRGRNRRHDRIHVSGLDAPAIGSATIRLRRLELGGREWTRSLSPAYDWPTVGGEDSDQRCDSCAARNLGRGEVPARTRSAGSSRSSDTIRTSSSTRSRLLAPTTHTTGRAPAGHQRWRWRQSHAAISRVLARWWRWKVRVLDSSANAIPVGAIATLSISPCRR